MINNEYIELTLSEAWAVLPEYLQDTSEDLINIIKQCIQENDRVIAEKGSLLYRQLGIAGFLQYGNDEYYYECVEKGIELFLSYLRKSDIEEQVLSNNQTLFDAINCNRFDAIIEISKLSRNSFNASYEYEEDFLYQKFLILFFSGENIEKCHEMVDRFKNLLNGDPDPRFNICKAFIDNDDKLFTQSFSILLEAYPLDIEKKLDQRMLSEFEFFMDYYFFTEGHALLKLASKHGFPTEQFYRTTSIQKKVTELKSKNFDPAKWKELPLFVGSLNQTESW